MTATVRLLGSALLYAGSTLGASSLARLDHPLALAAAVVLSAGAVLGTAALVPTGAFSRRALLGAGAILTAWMVLPLAFTADPAAWVRDVPTMTGYSWLWLAVLGLPYGRSRAWCMSTRVLLITAAVLGGASAAILASS